MRTETTTYHTARLMGTVGLLILLAAALVACTSNEQPLAAEPTSASDAAAPTLPALSDETSRGQAPVDSVDILILESFPVQVNAIARGNLPDSCTVIENVITQREDSLFRVVLTTVREPQDNCVAEPVAYDRTISLDVLGLPAGTYTVSVNDVAETFTLDIDNSLPEDLIASVSTPAVDETGAGTIRAISGRVWHDVCAATGTESADSAAAAGCMAADDGTSLQANGILESTEEGIANVQIHLLGGDCTAALPGDELLTLTDETGVYRFDNLAPGAYCVFIDVADDHNATALEEGILTYPTSNGVVTNSVTVELGADDDATDVNFGFDYRFRPILEGAADCTNSFKFIQDLNVPDDTVFAPGAAFDVQWRLENNGTCPWTEGYSVALISGDAMSATERTPLPGPVAPGQTVDAAVSLVAPSQPGTYRANFQLADAANTTFGVNGVAEDVFWVQIVVEEGAAPVSTPAPGSGVIGGVVWDDLCFRNADGTASRGCIEDGEGSDYYRADGSLNPGEAVLPGITVILGRGACPDNGIIAAGDRLNTTKTDDDGLYRFTGLDAGIYCVSIEALSADNVNLLIPGNWTYPAVGTGRLGVRLAAGEQRTTVDFGWDYQE